jgi:hypothetical protein
MIQLPSVKHNKHSYTEMMIAHIFSWGLIIFCFACGVTYYTGNYNFLAGFTITSMAAHFIIEWPISRAYNHFWNTRQKQWMFFMMILEQFLLYISLILLYQFFL